MTYRFLSLQQLLLASFLVQLVFVSNYATASATSYENNSDHHQERVVVQSYNNNNNSNENKNNSSNINDKSYDKNKKQRRKLLRMIPPYRCRLVRCPAYSKCVRLQGGGIGCKCIRGYERADDGITCVKK